MTFPRSSHRRGQGAQDRPAPRRLAAIMDTAERPMRDQFSHRPTPPGRCALGVAYPTTPDAFVDGLLPGAPFDFARLRVYESRHRSYPTFEDLWSRTCSACAGTLLEVIDEVQTRGVEAQHPCPLDALPVLFERDVVTLIAHWQVTFVLPYDLIDVPSWAVRLSDPHDALAARVLAQLPVGTRDRLGDDEAALVPESLAAALNGVINDGWIDSADAPGVATPEGPNSGARLLRCARNRDLIDVHFRDLIIPGNRIELSDGLHTADAIIRQIPEEFSGFLDLTVCNSVLLGEQIKRKRPQCIIVMNRDVTELRTRAVIYRHQIDHLSRDRKKNYVDVLAELRIGIYLYLQGIQKP